MPLRKQWRWVGYFSAEVMACAGDARIGPVRKRWTSVALPDGSLHERGVTLDLRLEEGPGVETVSPVGGKSIWTRKQALVPARGRIAVAGRAIPVEGVAFVDESAGHHARHTVWRWSAGNGRDVHGRAVAWNLVAGIHDSARDSERRVWVEGGEPVEPGPATFAEDLSWVESDGARLEFTAWCAREEHTNLVLLRNDYVQPFGTFAGALPGGIELAEGYGVMEHHDVRW